MQSISYNRQLTMPNDIQSTVRSVSTNIDDTKMLSFITEAQLQDIKPVIGDSLYIDLLKYANRSETDPVNEVYDALMDGAIYQYNDVDYMFALIIVQCLNLNVLVSPSFLTENFLIIVQCLN